MMLCMPQRQCTQQRSREGGTPRSLDSHWGCCEPWIRPTQHLGTGLLAQVAPAVLVALAWAWPGSGLDLRCQGSGLDLAWIPGVAAPVSMPQRAVDVSGEVVGCGPLDCYAPAIIIVNLFNQGVLSQPPPGPPCIRRVPAPCPPARPPARRPAHPPAAHLSSSSCGASRRMRSSMRRMVIAASVANCTGGQAGG